MSTRFKWFSVSPMRREELKAASERFLKEKYVDSKGFGVLLQDVRSNYLNGQYIEKTIVKERVVDPFGKETVFEIPQYRTVFFRLASSFPQLELVNPLRSLGQFLTFFGDCTDNSTAVEPVIFDLASVCDLLHKDGEQVTVRNASVSNIVLSNTVSADASIHGEEDVMSSVNSFMGKRKYLFSGTKTTFRLAGEDYCAELSSSGRVRLLMGDVAKFTGAFRRILGKVAGAAANDGNGDKPANEKRQ